MTRYGRAHRSSAHSCTPLEPVPLGTDGYQVHIPSDYVRSVYPGARLPNRILSSLQLRTANDSHDPLVWGRDSNASASTKLKQPGPLPVWSLDASPAVQS